MSADAAMASAIFEAATAAPLAGPPFVRVSVADVLSAPDAPTAYWWGGLIPAGALTLWTGHGGSAKTLIMLMLAVALAAGVPLFGEATQHARVAFFSAEDPPAVVRNRLGLICQQLGINPLTLDERLHLLDATLADPALFHELQSRAGRTGATTPAYDALYTYLKAEAIDVLIVDNASDTFDASEIDRARVRGFVRALRRLVPAEGAVVLLAHVDKATSRGDRGTGEAYSGSTAWHNSARSRIVQSMERDGSGITLEHQKNNYGPKHPPIRLTWPAGSVPQLDMPPSGFVQHIEARQQIAALLRLIAEYNERGEFVSTATTSRANAPSLLGREPTFPRVASGEVFDLIRRAERAGHLTRVTYKGADRKARERWDVTPEGRQAAGISASAASAATTHVTADSAVDAGPAATAATSPPGGVGERARTKDAAGSLANPITFEIATEPRRVAS